MIRGLFTRDNVDFWNVRAATLTAMLTGAVLVDRWVTPWIVAYRNRECDRDPTTHIVGYSCAEVVPMLPFCLVGVAGMITGVAAGIFVRRQQQRRWNG